jgi:hypothetical protein
MLVQVPIDYTQSDIVIKIANGQGITFEQQAEVVEGFATIVSRWLLFILWWSLFFAVL